jgi:hypothetical protein
VYWLAIQSPVAGWVRVDHAPDAVKPVWRHCVRPARVKWFTASETCCNRLRNHTVSRLPLHP